MTNLKRFSPNTDLGSQFISPDSINTVGRERVSESDRMESQDITDSKHSDPKRSKCFTCTKKAKEIQSLQKSLDEVTKQLEEQITKTDALEAALSNSSKNSASTISLMEIELGCLKSKVSENEYRIRELSSLNQLQDSVIQNNRDDLMKTRKQYESEIDHLRQTIDEKKYQIRHLLDLQKGSNIDVDLTSIPSKKEVKDLKQTLADTQRQLDDWIAKAKSLETKLTDSDTQLTLYRETVDTTRLAYRSELSKGTSNVSDLTAKIESLETIISQLTLESSDYKKQHESDSNRIRELTSLLHHRDVALITAQEEIQQNKSKYDLSLKSLKESALKDQSKIIGEQKAAYEKQIQSLNSSLVKANAKIAELAEANKQQEIQLRQRSGSDSYNLKDYLIFAQGEINSLNKQLASANERIQQLQEAAVINSRSSSRGGGSNRQSLSHSSTTGTEGLDNRSTLSSSHSEADRIAAAAAAALKFNQKGINIDNILYLSINANGDFGKCYCI